MDDLSGLASTLAAGVDDVRGCLVLRATALVANGLPSLHTNSAS